jgi:hypothetical protein
MQYSDDQNEEAPSGYRAIRSIRKIGVHTYSLDGIVWDALHNEHAGSSRMRVW